MHKQWRLHIFAKLSLAITLFQCHLEYKLRRDPSGLRAVNVSPLQRGAAWRQEDSDAPYTLLQSSYISYCSNTVTVSMSAPLTRYARGAATRAAAPVGGGTLLTKPSWNKQSFYCTLTFLCMFTLCWSKNSMLGRYYTII